MDLRLSSWQLKRAAGLQAKIEDLQSELSQLLGAAAASGRSNISQVVGRGGRRQLSAAGRARIARAQRTRWANYRKKSGKPRTPSTNLGQQRRRFSPAALARISRAQKARWAKYRGNAVSS